MAATAADAGPAPGFVPARGGLGELVVEEIQALLGIEGLDEELRRLRQRLREALSCPRRQQRDDRPPSRPRRDAQLQAAPAPEPEEEAHPARPRWF